MNQQQTQQYELQEAETVADFLRRPKQDHQLQMEFNSVNGSERHYKNYYADNNCVERSQFTNVPLYDEERVKMPDKEFIHASMIITPEATGGVYIQAQAPLVRPKQPRVDTQETLWKMIWLYGIELCVTTVQLGQDKHCDFFFNSKAGGTLKIGPFVIYTQEVTTKEAWAWTYYRLRLNTKEDKNERTLHMIVCDAWTDDPRTDDMRFETLADLLDFAWAIEDDCGQQRRAKGQMAPNIRQHPTLVLSRAGQNRSGLYVAASIIGRELQSRGATPQVYSLQNVEDKIRKLRAIRHAVFDRRSNFVMLVQALIEIACRRRLVRREETEDARRVLRRCHAVIQSKRTPRG